MPLSKRLWTEHIMQTETSYLLDKQEIEQRIAELKKQDDPLTPEEEQALRNGLDIAHLVNLFGPLSYSLEQTMPPETARLFRRLYAGLVDLHHGEKPDLFFNVAGYNASVGTGNASIGHFTQGVLAYLLEFLIAAKLDKSPKQVAIQILGEELRRANIRDEAGKLVTMQRVVKFRDNIAQEGGSSGARFAFRTMIDFNRAHMGPQPKDQALEHVRAVLEDLRQYPIPKARGPRQPRG